MYIYIYIYIYIYNECIFDYVRHFKKGIQSWYIWHIYIYIYICMQRDRPARCSEKAMYCENLENIKMLYYGYIFTSGQFLHSF